LPVVSDNDDYEQQLRPDNNDDDDVPLLQRSPLSIEDSDSNYDSSSPGSPSKQTRQSFRKGFQYPRRCGSLLVGVAVIIFCGGYRQQLYYKKDGKSRNRNSSSDDRPPDRQYRNPNLVADKASHHQQHHPAVLLATNIRNLQVIDIRYASTTQSIANLCIINNSTNLKDDTSVTRERLNHNHVPI
jgi:hypothetical protein